MLYEKAYSVDSKRLVTYTKPASVANKNLQRSPSRTEK